ncbi:MAG: sigma 54-interacting transcriptional regulator [Kofleriaceae bacterium]
MNDYILIAGGTQVRLGAEPVAVGRGRTNELVVRDPSVSRHHLQVHATDGGVAFEVSDGAAPILHRGQHVTRAIVKLGEHVIVGSTIVSVATLDDAALRSDGETRLGVEADIRGLSAVASLVEELAEAADVTAAAEAWVAATLAGTVVDGVVHAGGDRVTRSLAAVATAVIRAARATETVRADLAELRTVAVGSARAFLGDSAAAVEIDAILRKLAASDVTALILGESGTGKTFAARLIHEASPRARESLRVINCAAIPEALLEAELFGAERGAFSGAVATRIGAFEAVGDGTLLLDEIGELSPASQAKLLRVLEERRFERVGSNHSIELRARILAATNRDLRAMSDAGTFRKDLFFRISVVTLGLPPLREREGDVVLLAERMLADLAPSAVRRVTGFSAEARAAITAYAWPGNARELRNAIEHALVLGETPLIQRADLPELVRGARGPAETPTTSVPLPADLRWLEERAIEAALVATGGNRTKAAAILGINRVTLQKKLAK